MYGNPEKLEIFKIGALKNFQLYGINDYSIRVHCSNKVLTACMQAKVLKV